VRVVLIVYKKNEIMDRRDFARMTGIGALTLQAFPTVVTAQMISGKNPEIPLGVVNHSLRAWRPNIMELLDFAIKQKLDSVSFNNLRPFESIDDKYLARVKEHAKAHDISIFVGVGGICERSDTFNNTWGDADTLVKEGIRVAKALESPVIGVRIGVLNDRYDKGGIKPRMEEVIKRMKSFRGPVSDAGLKFAFENHAGDMRTEELLDLISETGTDICGAYFDPGNAIYALEDPKPAMEALGKHILCCSARDVVVWQSEDGAIFQWTAIGEGMMDFKHYTSFLSENCPGVPIHLEIISNSPRSLPFLTDEFMEGWPDLKATGLMDFLKLARKGSPIAVAQAPPGMEKKAFDMQNQEEELLRSIKYLREEFGVGLK
jgi:sugar phosphate isomerase/epimerase